MPTPRRTLPLSLISPSPPCRGRACPTRALPKASTPILNNSPCQPPRPHQLSARAGISPRPKNAPQGRFCPAVRWMWGLGFSIPARVTFYARHLLKSAYKEKSTTSNEVVLLGDLCVHLPRTKKQSAGLFFAACGRPSCSIPRTEAPKKLPSLSWGAFFGDPCGNRTHVNGVRGRCLNRLTNGP